METEATTSPETTKRAPLSSKQRRVLGVLVEKAKTTPDAYPMSVNGLVAGCNQKSNRDPIMNLNDEQVEQTLNELRAMGAAAEVQGSGRVPRYRHYFKEFLGVNGAEVAVMAELLLRGEQTLGDLRGRAARMDPIPDVNALKPIVDGLVQRGLMLELTPPGRGQIVSHNFYKERELVELQAKYAGHSGAGDGARAGEDEPALPPRPSPTGASALTPAPALPQISAPRAPAGVPAGGYVTRDMFNELELEVAELRAEMSRFREALGDLLPKRSGEASQ